jgi:hypothetical protein
LKADLFYETKSLGDKVRRTLDDDNIDFMD